MTTSDDRATGLLQLTAATFKAYADEGFDTNIYDIESQMRAWRNYVNSRYGTGVQINGRCCGKCPEHGQGITE
jgi:SLT domain-containing protein